MKNAEVESIVEELMSVMGNIGAIPADPREEEDLREQLARAVRRGSLD